MEYWSDTTSDSGDSITLNKELLPNFGWQHEPIEVFLQISDENYRRFSGTNEQSTFRPLEVESFLNTY